MKGFLIFCGLTALVVAVAFALPYLDSRDKAYEARLVGALNFVESAVEASRPISVEIYDPEIAPLAASNTWRLSGVMVSHDSVGKMERASVAAVLQSRCEDAGNPECWQIKEFTLGGKVVNIAMPATTGENPVQDASSADGTQAASSTTSAGGVDGESALALGGSGETPETTQPSQAALEAGAETGNGAAAETAPDGQASAAVGETDASGQSTGSASEAAKLEEMSRKELVRRIQEALTTLRYEPGPVDGRYGSRTAAAILSYQRDKGLAPDGRASKDLLHHLNASVRELAQ